MDPKKLHISRLEALPQDLLGEIVSRIVVTSPEDYLNCILSCKELGASTNDERVRHKLNLTPLVNNPRAVVNYLAVMQKCLAKNIPDAHYIKGILEYFVNNHSVIGLHHLGIAANAGHKEATYLYAIILLCRGRTEEGNDYLSRLKWVENTTLVNTCWRNIKSSLCGIRVARKRCYAIPLRQMRPTNVSTTNKFLSLSS